VIAIALPPRLAAKAFTSSVAGALRLEVRSGKTIVADGPAEAAGIGASTGHAVHGAIGFTAEHSLHLKTRRLWAWRAEYGSQNFWSQRLGVSVCESGASGLWPMLTQSAKPKHGAMEILA